MAEEDQNTFLALLRKEFSDFGAVVREEINTAVSASEQRLREEIHTTVTTAVSASEQRLREEIHTTVTTAVSASEQHLREEINIAVSASEQHLREEIGAVEQRSNEKFAGLGKQIGDLS